MGPKSGRFLLTSSANLLTCSKAARVTALDEDNHALGSHSTSARKEGDCNPNAQTYISPHDAHCRSKWLNHKVRRRWHRPSQTRIRSGSHDADGFPAHDAATAGRPYDDDSHTEG